MTGVELIAQERNNFNILYDEKDAPYIIETAMCFICEPYKRIVLLSSGLCHKDIYESINDSNNARIRELVKAGAMIAAEIDRLLS